MKKRYVGYYLVGLYFLFVLVKSIFSYFIATPTMFGDEYFFAKMARSFFNNFNFYIHGEPSDWGRPLYSIVLSISYLFSNMKNVYLFMKIINVLASSLIIFPGYLLARGFFNRKKSILLAILVSVLPMNFAFSSYIMSENIFYVLFLFSIYFLYKSLNEGEVKWSILAGLFIGLCSICKIQGLILFPILILFLNKNRFKHLLYIIGASSILLIPYSLLNGYHFGFTITGLLGYQNLFREYSPFSLVSFLYWYLMHFSYLILAVAVFPFLSKFDFKKEKLNLFLILILGGIFLIAMASYHTSRYGGIRPVGRYIDAIIPVILIFGLANLKENKKTSFLKAIIVLGFVIFSFKLLNYSLFPSNFLMLSHLGVINSILGKWVGMIFILITFLTYFLIKKLSIKKVIILLSIFFVGVSFLCYAINFYNANNNWNPLDQVQAGLWLNEFDNNPNKIVFFEKVDKGVLSKLLKNQPLTRGGFWINGEIIHKEIGELGSYRDVDYILSVSEIQNFELIKEFGYIKIFKHI